MGCTNSSNQELSIRKSVSLHPVIGHGKIDMLDPPLKEISYDHFIVGVGEHIEVDLHHAF